MASKSHVRLCLMTRNEAKSLPALAEAVLPMIDSWCIVDDPRSDDGTAELAQELFGHLPGQVHTSKLTAETFDFAKGRNELLELARPSDPKEAHKTWLMLVDADSPPVGKLHRNLNQALYTVDIKDRVGWSWTTPFLLRADVAAEYHLPAHEYLKVQAPSGQHLDPKDIYISRTSTGADEKRMRWTIDVLLKELDGPDAGRAAFYLANTYQSLGDDAKALEYYIRRVGIKGDDEETFFAMYRVGVFVQKDDPMRAVQAFLDAYGLRPTRPEPMYRLATIANALGQYPMALALANQGLILPATNDWMFVERWIADWGLDYQWAIAAHHLGLEEAEVVFDKLLARDDLTPGRDLLGVIPREEIERLRSQPIGEAMTALQAGSLPNWFAMYADQYFGRHLTEFADTDDFRSLQIGCFAGDASAWLLEYVVTGDGAILTDVDTWEGSEDIHDIDFQLVEARYDEQTGPFVKHHDKQKMASGDYFASIPREPVFDFIYIDGDHTAYGTLSDAVDAYRVLKVGGILAFDDYTWRGDIRALHCPYPAIDAFMSLYADRFEVLEVGAQVWLKRTA